MTEVGRERHGSHRGCSGVKSGRGEEGLGLTTMFPSVMFSKDSVGMGTRGCLV